MSDLTFDEHLQQAHHHGLIVGAVVGSCLVYLALAIGLVTSNHKLLVNPLEINKAQIGTAQSNSENTPGKASTTADDLRANPGTAFNSATNVR